MSTIIKDLGVVTAYAYAVEGGYTGTEAEFVELLGNVATDLAEIENLTVTVSTLQPGSSATASYSNGVLALGIPRGDTGEVSQSDLNDLKSELDFKLPFGVESITVGDTILDNVTLSMQKDGDEDWYISNNISGLTTTNFTKDNYYILEIDGVSKLCRGEYLPSGYPDFGESWHDCTVVGDLGLIGKRCATPEEIAALPEGTVVHGGYYATFDNRFPEFKFDDYCIARRFKKDADFNLYTSDTSATHTVTLKSATVVFTQIPSYLSGMNGVARYTNVNGKANTSLGNAGLQPSNNDTIYAEGIRNYVTDQAAHAEGAMNVASGVTSHVEGHKNIASGHQSHAEGRINTAADTASHASGMLNVASGIASFVIGQACIEDTEQSDRAMNRVASLANRYKKHVFIVGNGISDIINNEYGVYTRSNAHTLDWSGNAEYAGDVKANACGGENPVSLVENADMIAYLAMMADVDIPNKFSTAVIKFNTVKAAYERDNWNKQMVANAVVKTWISAAEYQTITGDTYA